MHRFIPVQKFKHLFLAVTGGFRNYKISKPEKRACIRNGKSEA